MREIDVKIITDRIAEMVIKANLILPEDVIKRIEECRQIEVSASVAGACHGNDIAADILSMIEENIDIARTDNIPLCQDTGMACIFMDIGQEVHFTGGDINEAVNEGVRIGYEQGYLRKSIVTDPLNRINTGDNTPAHIVYDIVPGDKVKITVAPKGFGSENMSRVKMLTPADGEEGVMDFIVDAVRKAGANPCPPVVVGVGIGSTFDGVALLAKKALLKSLDEENEDPYYRDMEAECLKRINELDIGPQGFGGATTALAVKILAAPTHIAGLPVAVNINCHVQRHESIII